MEENELPGDLIREILARLPARLLLKLKSVCRSWNSLISSHEFALHHLQRSTPTQSRPLLCWNHGIRENEKENDNNEDYEWIHCSNIITTDTIMHSRYFINYKGRKQRRTQGISLVDSFTIDGYIDGAKGIIRGSCNGLLCLSDSGFPFHTLTLFNPTTRSVSPSLTFQCPRPIPHPSLDPNYPQQNTLFWGFGYDSLRDKYKFLIDCCNSSPSSSWSSGAIVCTFGGATKTVDHPAFQYHIYGSDGIFFKGTLNWSACDPITVREEHMWSSFPTKKTWFVLTFDLETESFGRLFLPPENSRGVPHLQVMDNSTLSVCFRYPYSENNFCVWIMKKKELEDGVDDEKDYYWKKLFKIPYFTISSRRVAALYYFRDYNIFYNYFDDHVVLTLDEYYHRLHMFHIRCYGDDAIGQPEIKPSMYLKSPASFYLCHETLFSPSHYWHLTTNN